MGPENEGRNSGVIGTNGQYWREQRRFLLKNLKDFGFGKTSMESIIQDEMAKLCSKLARFPEVNFNSKTFIKMTLQKERESGTLYKAARASERD